MTAEPIPRPRSPRAAFALALATLATLAAADAVARPSRADAHAARKLKMPPNLPSRALKTGMKGYGLTVRKHQKIERFDVEIIGVLHHALPQQDMILIRCAGLGLEHSGIVAGMSGSPIFIRDGGKDKLIGALSYGFSFNKDPVAGVTPIANMWPDLERARRPVPEMQRVRPAPKRAARVQVPGHGELRPVAVPLSFAGFHPEVVAAFQDEWQAHGFLPMAAGGVAGNGSADGGLAPSDPFKPGSAISLSLTRGDMAVAGIGTITWVVGDRFIAFGHPFKGAGDIVMPVGNADIQWILASQASSFKMGHATSDLGVLEIDRQPSISGTIGPRAEMVPFDAEVVGADVKTRTRWHVELTDQPQFFPLAVAMATANIVKVSEPLGADATVVLKLRFELEDHPPVEVVEHLVGLSGTGSIGEVRQLAGNAAKAFVFNGFERIRVQRVRARVEVRRERGLAFLEAVRLPTLEVAPGTAPVAALTYMVPNKGMEEVTLQLPTIPEELAGETIKVNIGPEHEMPDELPPPAGLDDILAAMRAYKPRNQVAAAITLAEPALELRGHRVTDLPLGVRDELAGHGRKTKNTKRSIRTRKQLPWAIDGAATITLRVKARP